MRRSNVVMVMAATMFNPPEHIRDMSDGGQQTIRMMDHILTQLEAIGMYYCPVEDLGGIGKLRTPKGFEPEISEALDKFLNETGWDDEKK